MFNSARLKLTFWYLVIIMVISVSFSAVIYRVDVSEVERFDRIQRSRIQNTVFIPGFGIFTPQIVVDPTLVEETERRIVLTLLTINVTILVISGITGYFLAGRTLMPIRNMVEEQNRFISDASHEINTPLTSLKLALEVYLRGKNQTITEAKTLVKESIDEVNKLQSLSSSLLQLAQYQKPKNNIRFEKVEVNEIVKAAIKKVTPMAKEKQIKINEFGDTAMVIGDKYSLTDLFVILLDNAIKYSPKESSIEIRTKTLRDQVNISVKDSGIGMDESDLAHIFDRFYRSDTARSKNAKGGYGLGLSIAKKIVDSHNGSINVKSAFGKGSIFTITLQRN